MNLKKWQSKSLAGEVVYRTLPLSRWRDQVDRSELTFSHPTQFMDIFENFNQKVFPSYSSGPNIGQLVPQDDPHNMFVSCWTTLERSSAMWQLYAGVNDCEPVTDQDAFVQVQVRIERLVNDLGASEMVDNAGIFAGRVQYFTSDGLRQLAANIAGHKGAKIKRDRDLHMVKREDFEWEQEVRLLLDPEQSDIDPASHPSLALCWQDVVTGIVLDPRLPNVDTVRREFEAKGFTCPIVKSQLCQRVIVGVPI